LHNTLNNNEVAKYWRQHPINETNKKDLAYEPTAVIDNPQPNTTRKTITIKDIIEFDPWNQS
jgi:hypothetical protein